MDSVVSSQERNVASNSNNKECFNATKSWARLVGTKHRKKIWIILGLFLAFPALLVDMGKPATSRCAFVTILMGI